MTPIPLGHFVKKWQLKVGLVGLIGLLDNKTESKNLASIIMI